MLSRLPFHHIYSIYFPSQKHQANPNLIKDTETHSACNWQFITTGVTPIRTWQSITAEALSFPFSNKWESTLLSSEHKNLLFFIFLLIELSYMYSRWYFLVHFTSQGLLFLVVFHPHKKFNPKLESYCITCRLLYNSFLTFFQFSTPPSSTFSLA